MSENRLLGLHDAELVLETSLAPRVAQADPAVAVDDLHAGLEAGRGHVAEAAADRHGRPLRNGEV
jgi:hypothetical protein